MLNKVNPENPEDIARLTTKKWVEIFDFSNGSYNPSKDIRFKTPLLRNNDLCDFNDAYIVITGKIAATNTGNNNNVYNRKVSLKHSAPFFNFIFKINNKLTEDAQDLDVLIPLYNLLYYSKNFRKTAGSFWNYYPDILSSGHYDPDDDNNLKKRIFYPIKNSESFDYKTKLIGTLPDATDIANNDVETELGDIKIVVPLKNLSNFMFNLDFLIINTEIELILKWSQNCVLTEKTTKQQKAAVPA